MKHVICPVCSNICIKYGKNKSGSQRWYCKNCKSITTPKIDNSAKQLDIFLRWLFGKDIQKDMPGEGRTFRRKTSRFWDIWPLPPVVESDNDVVYADGIYLGKKACVLICCNDTHVLGWYLCRYEHSRAWVALLSRIAKPSVVVSDGGSGFAKALIKVWPDVYHQRCLFHVFCQVRRYTTSKPKTLAGIELYMLSRELLRLNNKDEADHWTEQFVEWMKKHNKFLSQKTYDENGKSRPTHERLLKAQRSILRLLKEGTLFTYLDDDLVAEFGNVPSTNNRIEGGINSRLRAMLREHRGLSIERRIKAVFWWCYMHSPEPLSASELLKTMPTDSSINAVYSRMSNQGKIQDSIPDWGDAVVWSELHHYSKYPVSWD